MSNLFIAFFVFVAGILFGMVFFVGLAWTTRKGLTVGNPALWFLGSWVIRMTIVLAGFYLVTGGYWQRLLVCLAGFMLARFVLLRLDRLSAKQDIKEWEARNETQS